MHAKKTNKTKLAVVLLAVVLLIGCTAGATLAWLMDKTDPVVNTFTYGDINIDLKEHELKADGTLGTTEVTKIDNYKMIPGTELPKDPFVTVEGGSEACWLFVKVAESANFDNFMTYDIDTAVWTALPGEGNDGVYYRKVDASNADQVFNVINGKTVTVKDTVTKAMLNALDAGEGAANYPTLTFTAYAIQQSNGTGTFTAAEAWAKINAPTT